MSVKIEVRYALFVVRDGRRSPAGARLFKGEESKTFPRLLLDAEKNATFDFDDEKRAKEAAEALEKYINATDKKPTKRK